MSTSKTCLLHSLGSENPTSWNSLRKNSLNCFPEKPDTVVSSACLRQKIMQVPQQQIDENDFWDMAGQCSRPIQGATVEPFQVNPATKTVCFNYFTLFWVIIIILIIVFLVYVWNSKAYPRNSFEF